MGERTSYAPGTFSWVDLQTGDQDAAKSFYGDLLGWDYEDMPVGEGQVYSMARVDGHDVAAIGPLQAQGVPPHWSCYVTVENADATLARARELGASPMGEAFDVFDSGRMGIIQDPQGAFVCVWEPRSHIGATLVNAPGALSWNDLASPDPEAAERFYGELFGWSVEPVPESEGRYWSIKLGDRLNGGIMAAPPGQPPAWSAYFAVEDLDAAVQRVGELGGGTLFEPMEVPAGRMAVVHDPQGAVFALFEGELEP